MPIKIPSTLPASQILESENIFVMDTERAYTQDIRPLKILILNLMPNKTVTETQLLRLLGNTPLQIEVDFIYTESYLPKHTSIQYLSQFYGTFEDVKDKYYDGFIITGAPVERMEYEEVAYWKEVCEIMDWSRKHAWSTFHICWGAFAGLYHHYGIKKYYEPKKVFGVYKHHLNVKHEKLFRGFDDEFYVPHSRHIGMKREDIEKVKDLTLNDSIFKIEVNDDALKKMIRLQLDASRQGTRKTKNRSEVSGGGRKPWRQKGTGRARSGSTRSPLWVGGGTVFGPSPRSYAFRMPRKQRRLAIKCALTDKVNNGDFIVLESLDFAAPKTKEVVKMMSDFNVAEKALIVTADVVENVEKSSRNIPGVKAISSCGLNVYDILNHNKLFITKDAITRIEEVLA